MKRPITVAPLRIENAGMAPDRNEFRVSVEEFENCSDDVSSSCANGTASHQRHESDRNPSSQSVVSRIVHSISSALQLGRWRTPSKRFIRGIICIVSVCIIWVASSFIVQNLVNEGGLPPLFLTYISNSLFIVLVIPSCGPYIYHFVMKKFGLIRRRQMVTIRNNPTAINTSQASNKREGRGRKPRPEHGNSSWLTYAKAAGCVCPIWFLAFYTFNKSLALTNVTANTILSTTSSLFIYVLSVLILNEGVSISKIACIFVSIIGSALVTVANTVGIVDGRHDENDSDNSGEHEWVGNLLCLLSAFLYAAYTVVMKKLLPSHDEVEDVGDEILHDDGFEYDDNNFDDNDDGDIIGDAPQNADNKSKGNEADLFRFFSLLGLFTMIFCLPLVLVAQMTHHIDIFSIPSRSIYITLGKGLIDNVLSDFLWARGVLLTSPTIASVGLSLQIPIAMIVEVSLPSSSIPTWMESSSTIAMTIIGAIFVTGGFYGVTTQSLDSQVREKEKRTIESDALITELDESARLIS